MKTCSRQTAFVGADWCLRAICLLVLVARPALGQSVWIGGYLEHQFNPQSVGGSISIVDYSKARLDVGMDVTDWLVLEGDAVGQLQHGKRRFSSFDFIPSRLVAGYANDVGVPVSVLEDDFSFRFDNELYVDNAHATVYLSDAMVRVGRQQLTWGSGYAWNPTDIFHDKNLLDPTYEKRGADAVLFSIPTSTLGSVTAVFGLETEAKRANKAVRWRQHVSGFDVTLAALETHDNRVDFYTGTTLSHRQRLVALDFSGTAGPIGLWFEGVYASAGRSDDFARVLLGADHTTESGLYLMTELYYNGRGAAGVGDYDFSRWMRLVSDAGEQLGQHYVFAGATRPLTDLLSGSMYAVGNVSDGSAVVYPYIEYSLSDNAILTLIGYATFGRSGTEFGSAGWGGLFRARLYF